MGPKDKRTLELTLISATDLKKVRTFGQDSCYAVAYIDDGSRGISIVDTEGGSNPTWNSKMFFTFEDMVTVTVEIYCRCSSTSKLVGTSKIPLLNGGSQINGNTPSFYAVRRPSGRVKGVLSVSMKLGTWSSVVHSNSDSVDAETSSIHPPTTGSHRVVDAGSVYPQPRAASSVTASDGVSPPNVGDIYPPHRASSSSSKCRYGAKAANVAQVSHKVSGGRDSHSMKVEEPVLAYPPSGYEAFRNPPDQYGLRDPPQYHPPAQANVPYSYQQAYYSKPRRPARRPGDGDN